MVRPGDVVIVHDPQPAGDDPGAARARRARPLALSHRSGRDQRRGPRAAGGSSRRMCANARRLRVLAGGVRPGERPRSTARRRHPADDRSVLGEEPAARRRAACARSSRSRADRGTGQRPHGCTFLREDGTPGRVDRAADVLRVGAAAARHDAARRAGLALGPAQGSDRRDARLRAPRRSSAPAARTWCSPGRRHRRRRRSRRRARARRRDRGVARAAARRARARSPRVAADRRHRRERRDRQRAAAPRDDHRAEEPAGGLRAHRHRGDVEGAAGRRERGRRHPGSDRRRRAGAAAPRSAPISTRSPRRSRAARRSGCRRADGRPCTPACSIATSASTRCCATAR